VLKTISVFIGYVSSGRQAVLVMACENMHMSDDLILDPGIVMIFAHGVE